MKLYAPSSLPFPQGVHRLLQMMPPSDAAGEYDILCIQDFLMSSMRIDKGA